SILSRAVERLKKGLHALPAVLGFDPKRLRGLDGIRSAVVSAAASPSPALIGQAVAQTWTWRPLVAVVGVGALAAAIGLAWVSASGGTAAAPRVPLSAVNGPQGLAARGTPGADTDSGDILTPSSGRKRGSSRDGSFLEGVVVDEAGRAVAGARLVAYAGDRRTSITWPETESLPEGAA